MEPLSSIATTIGALLALATAAVNLASTLRSRTRRSSDRDGSTDDHRDGDNGPLSRSTESLSVSH
jgi:hypothetical protein